MKKLLLLITLCITILFSCQNTKKLKTYQLTVEVYYPNKIDTIIITGEFEKFPKIVSINGSNKIYDDMSQGCHISTSAPLKIINVYEIK